MTNKNKSIVREGYTKSNLKEPPTADRPPPPRSQVAFRPSKTESLADRFKAKFSQAHSQSRPLIISWELAVEIRDALSGDSPAPDTGLAGQIEAARARIAGWPADVRAAMGLPDETTAKHQGWCASINPDPCNCGIATKGASAWCPHYDLPIVNQPGCPDCAHEKTTGQWDPRAAAVKQDPHCATCKCFSEEPSPPHPGPSIEKAFANSPRRVVEPTAFQDFAASLPEKASARPIPPGRMCNTHGNWNCSECCPPENGNGDAT